MNNDNKKELYRSRYLASWREREIDKDGTLKTFSIEDIMKIKPENFETKTNIVI